MTRYFHKKVDARTCDCCTAEIVDSLDRDLSSITEPLRPAVMIFVKCKLALYFTLQVCHCFRIQFGLQGNSTNLNKCYSQKFSENVLFFSVHLEEKMAMLALHLYHHSLPQCLCLSTSHAPGTGDKNLARITKGFKKRSPGHMRLNFDVGKVNIEPKRPAVYSKTECFAGHSFPFSRATQFISSR